MDEKRECGRALPRDHRITWSDCIEPEGHDGPHVIIGLKTTYDLTGNNPRVHPIIGTWQRMKGGSGESYLRTPVPISPSAWAPIPTGSNGFATVVDNGDVVVTNTEEVVGEVEAPEFVILDGLSIDVYAAAEAALRAKALEAEASQFSKGITSDVPRETLEEVEVDPDKANVISIDIGGARLGNLPEAIFAAPVDPLSVESKLYAEMTADERQAMIETIRGVPTNGASNRRYFTDEHRIFALDLADDLGNDKEAYLALGVSKCSMADWRGRYDRKRAPMPRGRRPGTKNRPKRPEPVLVDPSAAVARISDEKVDRLDPHMPVYHGAMAQEEASEPETPPGPTTQCPVCETRLAVLGDLKRFGAATETVTMHLPFCSGRPAKVR